ncbi:hypothetical protein ACQR0V_25500 [Bradyrhizobium sp. HKCCYLS2058]|uniref:hypothetical protein n=1 Tax=Bradyrhizobium TaxID=374 RepID=UPI0029170DBE|nr:hypothetical protein [Bradyrhizobium sp. SZCCHNR1015]
MESFAAQWLTAFFLIGLMFGVLFSPVREFFRRFVFSAVLFLIVYKALVNASGHAGLQWEHLLAIAGVVGSLLGCLVRPGVVHINRRLRR